VASAEHGACNEGGIVEGAGGRTGPVESLDTVGTSEVDEAVVAPVDEEDDDVDVEPQELSTAAPASATQTMSPRTPDFRRVLMTRLYEGRRPLRCRP